MEATSSSRAWGDKRMSRKQRMVDTIDWGVNFFDTADVLQGLAEEILGQAVVITSRENILISPAGHVPVQGATTSARQGHHISCVRSRAACAAFGTEYIDTYHMHGFDASRAGDAEHACGQRCNRARSGT